MQKVYQTVVGFFLLGLILIGHSFYASGDSIMAVGAGKSIAVTPIDSLGFSQRVRAKSSGPKLYRFRANVDSTSIIVISKNDLEINKKVTCIKFNSSCFDIDEQSIASYVESIYVVNLLLGLVFWLVSFLTYIFRVRILVKLKETN